MSSNNGVINVLNITRSHGKKFPKLSQTSFSGIVYYKNDQVRSLFYLDTLMRVTRGVTLTLRNNNLVALLWDNFHLDMNMNFIFCFYFHWYIIKHSPSARILLTKIAYACDVISMFKINYAMAFHGISVNCHAAFKIYKY